MGTELMALTIADDSRTTTTQLQLHKLTQGLVSNAPLLFVI